MDQVCHRSEIFLGWFMNCGSTPHPGGQSQPPDDITFWGGGVHINFDLPLLLGWGVDPIYVAIVVVSKRNINSILWIGVAFLFNICFQVVRYVFSVTGPCFDLWYFRFQGLECSEWGKKLNLLNVPNVMWITWRFPSSHHFHSHTLRVEMLMISSD